MKKFLRIWIIYASDMQILLKHFIHFKCTSFKNHLKQEPELWISSNSTLKELSLLSKCVIDIPSELITECF